MPVNNQEQIVASTSDVATEKPEATNNFERESKENPSPFDGPVPTENPFLDQPTLTTDGAKPVPTTRARAGKRQKFEKSRSPQIAIFNPWGTSFMARYNMHALLVTLNQKDMDVVEPNKLYHLQLEQEDGTALESLYFSKSDGASGEMMLFKQHKTGLKRVSLIAAGTDLPLKMDIKQGESFSVRSMFPVRSRVEGTPAEIIETIREDIEALERNFDLQCEAQGVQRVIRPRVTAE